MSHSNSGLVVWLIMWSTGTVVMPVCRHVLPKLLGRAVCLSLGVAVLVGAPLVMLDQEDAMFRGILSFAGLFYLVRNLELLFQTRFDHEPLWRHCVHVGCSFHDVQLAVKSDAVRWSVHLGSIVQQSLVVAVIAVLFANQHVCAQAVGLESPVLLAAVCAGVYTMVSLSIFGELLQFLFALVGYKLPTLMDAPYKSRSLQEFWGARWNSVVQRLLKHYVYSPLRKQRLVPMNPAIASFATFFASGLLHVYPAFVAGFGSATLVRIMAYFLVQMCALLFETGINLSKVPDAGRYLWTVSAVVGPAPLLFTSFVSSQEAM